MTSSSGNSFFCSTRFGLALLGLTVCFTLYAQRMAMSVAIVCMVNHTAVAELQSRQTHLALNQDVVGRVEDTADGVTQMSGTPSPQGALFSPCGSSSISNESSSSDGPFTWSKDIQGHILGSFFYGYLISQIPSGLLAERFGAKWILIGFLGTSTVGTLLTPAAARIGYEALIFLRIIVGFGSGALFPAMHAMWSQWAPPLERSKLVGISYAGTMMGSVVSMPVSGFLCRYGFDDGWGSVFYTIGALSVLSLICFAIFTTSTPATNRIISNDEKRYIAESLSGEVADEKISWRDMPWRKMMLSGPVWAIIVANFCMDWGAYTLMTNIPTFYREVLNFDIESSGMYSALPFIGLWICMNACPLIADYLRSQDLLSTTVTRKLFTSIGLIGGALFLIGLSFVDCTMTGLAVGLLTIAVTLSGTGLSGFWVNHMDIAPRYAGTLMGISNGIAAMSGFIAPYVAAALTRDQTRESWQKVFFISAALNVLGTVVYCVLGTGVIQPWAVHDDQDLNIETEKKDSSKRSNIEIPLN